MGAYNGIPEAEDSSWICDCESDGWFKSDSANRACKSRARKRGWGQLRAGSPLFSMLMYRTSFRFWL